MDETLASQRAAWENPTWVLTLMMYPQDHTLLGHVAAGNESLPLPQVVRNAWDKARADTVRAANAAGMTLAILYALNRAPWSVTVEPSLALAIHCVEQLEFTERKHDAAGKRNHPPRRAPRGHTKIEESLQRMRPVAHLWAAVHLHREYPMMPHEELLKTEEGVRKLLAIASSVQNWARRWRPSRTARFEPLLGPAPWLVPSTIVGITPPWAPEPSELLKNAIATYQRRRR